MTRRSAVGTGQYGRPDVLIQRFQIIGYTGRCRGEIVVQALPQFGIISAEFLERATPLWYVRGYWEEDFGGEFSPRLARFSGDSSARLELVYEMQGRVVSRISTRIPHSADT